MEIVGRLTKDASVNQTKSTREVVNFSVAVNENYKPKGSHDYVQQTTFFNCSYWLTSKIASVLRKGVLVQLIGNLSVSAYTNAEGQPKADLKFHVNAIKILSKPATAIVSLQPSELSEPLEDLPF